MAVSTTLIDLSGRFTDSQHSVANHEIGHGLSCEQFGIAIKEVSIVPSRSSSGHVKQQDGSMWPDSTAMLAVVVGGYEATHASIQGGDAAGARSDFEYARKLALRLSGGDQDKAAEMIAEAHGRAAEMMAEDGYARKHDALKRALLERGSLTALEFGEILANLTGGRYLAAGRVTDLRGDEGPCEAAWKRKQGALDLAEELDKRTTRLQELGVRAHRRPAPKTTTHKRKVPATTALRGSMRSSRGVLPQDNLYRAVYELPSAFGGTPAPAVTQTSAGTGRTLDLQWYVANQWAEINSAYEGQFMEMIAPGAAAKTIAENQSNMRILLQHGGDPQIGDKPIAKIDEVGENGIGGYARGELFPGLDPLVVDGLRAGQYGASFRFRVTHDELNQEAKPSNYNPKGLPERTIREMAVQEFGPVTWGAYPAASAGVRSLTDEIMSRRAVMAAAR